MGITTSAGNASHYKQIDSYTGVAEADPHQLVQMLLNGALEKTAVAKGLIAHKQTAQKGEAIGRAISIVSALRSSLDMSAGGELAANLDNLYEYIERRLLEANLHNDVAILDEVLSLLREIKTAWDSIPKDLRAKPDAVTAAV